jgi:hypothetical protein
MHNVSQGKTDGVGDDFGEGLPGLEPGEDEDIPALLARQIKKHGANAVARTIGLSRLTVLGLANRCPTSAMSATVAALRADAVRDLDRVANARAQAKADAAAKANGATRGR